MPYEFTPQGLEVQESVKRFMESVIYPNEETYYSQLAEVGPDGYPPVLDKLKAAALERGLWNLFLPHLRPGSPGTTLSNLDYAPVSEMLGKVPFASEALNCNAPDTGNMEILHLYGSDKVKAEWLEPLLAGEIRSAFSMTEPDIASSDASNIGLSIERDGDHYVLNGRKWFSSGARAERCKVLIVMGKTNPKATRHLQQSMIVVPKSTPGVELGLDPHVFGYAERALELMVIRSLERSTFGTSLAHKGLIQDWIAESRIEIDMARQYVLHTAHLMDTVGNKAAATDISGIKVAIPNVALKVIDRAIQVHGAAGVSQFFPLANMYAHQRTLRIADGPDEVHKMTIARREILKHQPGFRMNPSAGS